MVVLEGGVGVVAQTEVAKRYCSILEESFWVGLYSFLMCLFMVPRLKNPGRKAYKISKNLV